MAAAENNPPAEAGAAVPAVGGDPKFDTSAAAGPTGTQKAAVLLISLGPEKSSKIFKHLKEEEIE